MSRKHRQLVASVRDQYDGILAVQDGHCALCLSEPKSRRLHIDHDHKTMEVRGLLCYRCNRALPSWVTPAWLRAAADYLESHSPIV